MDNEPHDETEYQFNDAEDATFEPSSPTESKGDEPANRPKKSSGLKTVLVIIFLVVAAFVIYKLYSFFVAPKVKTTPSVTPISTIQKSSKLTTNISSIPTKTTPAAIKPIVAMPKVTTSKVTIPAVTKTVKSTPIQTVATTQVKDLNTLAQAVSKVQSSSDSINSKLTQNDLRMNSLDQKITTLNNGLSELQDTLSSVQSNLKQTRTLENQINAYRKQLSALTERKIRLRKQYFVQAVVPGRAWLRGADGTARTISIGETLPGYGKIRTIDPYSGTVTTSTGVKLYYGLNEN